MLNFPNDEAVNFPNIDTLNFKISEDYERNIINDLHTKFDDIIEEYKFDRKSISNLQEIYICLVVVEDFDAYYDSQYSGIVDYWIYSIWKEKSNEWKRMLQLAYNEKNPNIIPSYWRPSYWINDKDWKEKNNIKGDIIKINSMTFHN